MHYNLARCTLTPGQRFLLENEKRKNVHVNSNVQRLASSASFIYFSVHSKSSQVKGSKHVPRVDTRKSGTEQGGALLLCFSTGLSIF